LVEFCHRVAAGVFETLCESGYRAVETRIMDVYFDLAETVRSPDELCLCLLESMSSEIEFRLTLSEQVDVLTGAASRLPPVTAAADPVSAAMETLQEHGVISTYTRSSPSVDPDGGTQSAVVHVSDYAFSPRDGRLPVLPLVLGILRHRPEWQVSSLRAADVGEYWKLSLVQSKCDEPTGLASIPIERQV
jgi:hypothetical protein